MNSGRLMLFILLIVICSVPAVFPQTAESGIIIELSGTVELKSSEAAPFTPANVSDQVWDDTVISTGFRSNALIEVGSIQILVRPLTRLTFTEIRTSVGIESLNVNLQAGRLRVDINPPAGTRASLDVVSPMAAASIRGTSFEFDTRNLIVSSGEVSFRGSAGLSVTVSAGFNSTPAENGNVWNPITAGASAYRPNLPSGMQPNTAPALGAVTFSESPGSNQTNNTGQGSNPDPDTPSEGDAGFDFDW